MQSVTAHLKCCKGRYNNDTHIDIGDAKSDVSRIWDFQHVSFSTGASFSFSMQICWKVPASILPVVALHFSSRYVFAYDKTSLLQKVNALWNSLETRTHLPLCDMPKKLCPILRFPSSVIATSFGLSSCLLLGINLNLQSESLAQEQHSKSRGPGHPQLKASWPLHGNKKIKKLCLQHIPHQDGCL